MTEIIIALIGTVGSIITAVITKRKISIKKDTEWKQAYRPKLPKQGIVKNTTLMVGLGRVGKTQLLKTITKNNPKQHILNISDDFTIIEHNVRNNGEKQINHFFTDYRGQNFSQLIASFIQEQLKPNTPLRYGDINTLLLIADLFPQEEGGRDELNIKYPEINIERVNEHNKTWNNIALDALFGLLTEEKLKSVFLFVNKVDKLESYTDEIKQQIKKEFKPLIDELDIRAENSVANFEFIIGSAVEGIKIIGLKSLTAFLNSSALNHK